MEKADLKTALVMRCYRVRPSFAPAPEGQFVWILNGAAIGDNGMPSSDTSKRPFPTEDAAWADARLDAEQRGLIDPSNAISAESMADRLGHTGRDGNSTLGSVVLNGEEFELRVLGVGADAFFEWINEGGDPVGDVMDEIAGIPAEKARFLEVLANKHGAKATKSVEEKGSFDVKAYRTKEQFDGARCEDYEEGLASLEDAKAAANASKFSAYYQVVVVARGDQPEYEDGEYVFVRFDREFDGTGGQDRESYSDDQDRESYS